MKENVIVRLFCRPISLEKAVHFLVDPYYYIRKKIRGGFNFVVFVYNKDPRIFFTKKAMTKFITLYTYKVAKLTIVHTVKVPAYPEIY